MAKLDLGVSKSEVNRAGDMLRRVLIGEDSSDGLDDLDGFVEAFDLVLHFRACHQDPLGKAAMGLRSTVASIDVGGTLSVSQRLKRFPTIAQKLVREPGLDLARMQDIGGCRAILPSISTIRAVDTRLQKRKGFRRRVDYIESPRSSGYRGIHVILRYDQRDIEVQLRTMVMHEWAIAVERLSGRLSHDLKSGTGPPEVIRLLSVVSEAMAIEEDDADVPQVMIDEIADARKNALPFMQ